MQLRLSCALVVLVLCGAATVASAQSTDERFAALRARTLGLDLFTEHCASCHGRTGHGDGPRAKEMSPRPSDLTRLAERNGWMFPGPAVAHVIDGADRVHRNGDMPLWGDVFRTGPNGGAEAAKTRIDALVYYLEFIQVKRPR